MPHSSTRSVHPAWGGVLLVLGLWALASLTYPYGRDQGNFGWVGDVILSGGVPYRDAWEVKGPLTYYLYALVRGVTGPGQWGIRLFELGVLLVFAGAMRRLGRRLGGRATARWAIALALLWFAGGSFWDTAQADGWCAMLVAVWLAWLGRDHAAGREMAVSALVGSAVLFLKPPLVVLGLLYPLHLFVRRGLPAGQVAGRTLGAGVLLALLGGAGALALHGVGALQPLVEIYRGFLLGDYVDQYASGPLAKLGEVARFLLLNKHFPLVLVPAFLGLRALHEREPGEAVFLLEWLGLALVCVVLQGRFFSYHWTLAYPPLALLAGHGAATRLRAGRPDGRVVGAVLLVAALALPLVEGLRAVRYLGGGMTRERYIQAFHVPIHYDYPAYEAVGRYVRERSQPGDPVLFWGVDAVVNVLARRPAVGRWGLSYRLYSTRDPALRGRYRAEFLAAFRRRPPAFVVIPEGDAMPPLQEKASAEYLAEFPELRELLARDYREATRVRSVRVLAREL